MNGRWLSVFILIFSQVACQTPKNRVPALAFFHWKNRLSLTPAEVALLDSMDCRTLYVKFLDVAREGGGSIRPYALLEVADTAGLSARQIVPCVFLTNSVFVGLSAAETEALAQKVALALSDVGRQFPTPVFSEIQLDCDWTERTRQPFFLFIKKLKQHLPPQTRLSATIRLHQYKFPNRTGVPPVERGLLMLYNTGDIQDPDEQNSIFSPDHALQYIEGAPVRYPLPLDVALPAFGWTLVYRDGYLWKIGPEHYVPPPYDGEQRVRREVSDTALLLQAAQVASLVRLAPDGRVAFFRLDSAAVARYRPHFLREVAARAAGVFSR